MTKAPVFPELLVEACLVAYGFDAADISDELRDDMRRALTTAHRMGYATEVPWREAAARELMEHGEAFSNEGQAEKARAMAIAAHQLQADPAPPAPVTEDDIVESWRGAAARELFAHAEPQAAMKIYRDEHKPGPPEPTGYEDGIPDGYYVVEDADGEHLIKKRQADPAPPAPMQHNQLATDEKSDGNPSELVEPDMSSVKREDIPPHRLMEVTVGEVCRMLRGRGWDAAAEDIDATYARFAKRSTRLEPTTPPAEAVTRDWPTREQFMLLVDVCKRQQSVLCEMGADAYVQWSICNSFIENLEQEVMPSGEGSTVEPRRRSGPVRPDTNAPDVDTTASGETCPRCGQPIGSRHLADCKYRGAVSAGGSEDERKGLTADPVPASDQPEPPTQAALEPGRLAYEVWAAKGHVPAWHELPAKLRAAWAAAEAAVAARARREALKEAAAFCRAQKMTEDSPSIALEIKAVNDAYGDLAVEFERRAELEQGK